MAIGDKNCANCAYLGFGYGDCEVFTCACRGETVIPLRHAGDFSYYGKNEAEQLKFRGWMCAFHQDKENGGSDVG